MSNKRFYLRLELQLHAVTCPGVWLCSHGYLEATLKTLGYYFRTGAMEPRFPMLCHDQFTMEGYFRRVDSMQQMRELLNAEQLEITLWQNGRRLAYYVGSLSDVMQPPIPRLSCAHSDNVQLLMKATSAFPGIIAPKVELSAVLSTKDKQRSCCQVDLQRPLGNRHVESRCLSRLERPRKQQQPVCHSKRSNCWPNSSSCSYANSSEQLERRLSTCSSSTQLSTQSQTLSQHSHGTQCSLSGAAAEHQSSCHICLAYRRLFETW
ncbi:spermatogenesis associated 6-like protein [Drosophila grimshawi]|uniref:GH14612 n=1 Tax=Drosophila grimshawi TaxID=7222 RepID=B4IY43_DROGR|nr:spermatogenesis associated 6-like protein [Drosophila grimshawi]EDV97586.1 GH14612 [Drosophila grimshawi]